MDTVMNELMKIRLLIEAAISVYERNEEKANPDDRCLLEEALYCIRDSARECMDQMLIYLPSQPSDSSH